MLHVGRVRPFAHTKGKTLAFLVEVQESFNEQIKLKPEQLHVLSEALCTYTIEFLKFAYSSSKDMADFVGHLDQYVEAAKPEHNSSPRHHD